MTTIDAVVRPTIHICVSGEVAGGDADVGFGGDRVDEGVDVEAEVAAEEEAAVEEEADADVCFGDDRVDEEVDAEAEVAVEEEVGVEEVGDVENGVVEVGVELQTAVSSELSEHSL